MLYLIGQGISDEKDLSLRAIDTLKQCHEIYFEYYTNVINKNLITNLEKIINQKIEPVDRKEVEQGKKIIENSKKKNIAVIVPGDPLIATTHMTLLIECKKKNIDYRIIHNSSIYSSAIGESGLHVYKFGNTVTIPKWYENYKPTSPYNVVLENHKRGLHTLLLIDLYEGRNLETKEVVNILNQMEKKINKNLFLSDTKILILSKLGYPENKIIYTEIKNLNKIKDLGHPYVLVYPGKLHFSEEEWLELHNIKI